MKYPPRPVEPNRPDHCYNLGLPQIATAAEIRKAYLAMSLKYHPDRAVQGETIDPANFRQVKDAYDILTNPTSRARYDAVYNDILREWISYDRRLARWEEADIDRQRRQSAADWKRRNIEEERRRQAREQRERREAEKARQTEEQFEFEARARKAAEDARKAEREAFADRMKKEKANEEEATSRRAAEEKRVEEEKASKERLRQHKWRAAQERSQKVLEKAQVEREKAAAARLRQREAKEAEGRMREAANLARTEEEREEQMHQQEEQEAEKQWRIALEHARAEEERKSHRAADASDVPQTEEEWIASGIWCQRKEEEAAERFIQEIMLIRGEDKGEVLKNVALITIEAIDLELKVQREKRLKRKFVPDVEDSARLPTLVDDLFERLEGKAEEKERFRFNKKRKTG